MNFFRNDRTAVFLERPNRFFIIAGDHGEKIPCHCPNPGRLLEMLFPGTPLILEARRPGGKTKIPAKTPYTAVAVYHHGIVAPLFAARANAAARELALPIIIPDLVSSQGEYRMGDSRFDFYCLDAHHTKHLVEVKCCSLIEYGVAMFPDAPSERALKHLSELVALSRQGWRCHVLFLITHSKAQRFVPNLHTDPAFAAALGKYGWIAGGADAGPCPPGKAALHAVQVNCNKTGRAVLINPAVPIDLSSAELAGNNSGSYIIILKLPESARIEVGALGVIQFKAGWYAYAGSAMKNLNQRIKRHLRKVKKKLHWHIDYITPYAESIQAFPIRSYRDLECDMAASFSKLGAEPVPGFGCSDCRCNSHLYYFAEAPMRNEAFVDMIMYYRHVEAARLV